MSWTKHDLVTKFTFGRAVSNSEYAQEHSDTYRKIETNIDAVPGLTDKGIHHSFYLYANTQEFRDALMFTKTPTIMTRPFAK
jgi:hypothetical protein